MVYQNKGDVDDEFDVKFALPMSMQLKSLEGFHLFEVLNELTPPWMHTHESHINEAP
jgi:hypothetical protein